MGVVVVVGRVDGAEGQGAWHEVVAEVRARLLASEHVAELVFVRAAAERLPNKEGEVGGWRGWWRKVGGKSA